MILNSLRFYYYITSPGDGEQVMGKGNERKGDPMLVHVHFSNMYLMLMMNLFFRGSV